MNRMSAVFAKVVSRPTAYSATWTTTLRLVRAAAALRRPLLARLRNNIQEAVR